MNRRHRPRLRAAIRAGSLLEALLAGWGLDERLHQYQALVVWDEVVGPTIAAHARPEKIRDGILEVCVDQPAWMQQLQLLKPRILAKLNARLGEPPLSEIFLKRGRVTPPPSPAAAAPPAWQAARLDAAELADLEKLLAGIEDVELRRDLEGLLVKQARLSKARRKT